MSRSIDLRVVATLTGAVLLTIALGTTAGAITQADCERQLDGCASGCNNTYEWPTQGDRARCISACNAEYNQCYAMSKD
jgi:hypothetical protein